MTLNDRIDTLVTDRINEVLNSKLAELTSPPGSGNGNGSSGGNVPVRKHSTVDAAFAAAILKHLFPKLAPGKISAALAIIDQHISSKAIEKMFASNSNMRTRADLVDDAAALVELFRKPGRV